MKAKQLVPIVAAIVVIIAGAFIFFINRAEEEAVLPSAGTVVAATSEPAPAPAETPPEPAAADDLMTPGPLGERALGDPKAPVTIIEYASLTCSHCQRFHSEVYRPFKEKYVDTGKVYFILREFPLDPLALAAIALARCAPAERFFPVVDLLFDTQRSWAFVEDPKTALFNVVKQAGFTQESFEACLTDAKISNGIDQVRTKAAEKLGVNSTPTFFINGKKQSGELSLEEIDKLVAPYL
jgi:protein-disulfide isomerase